MFMFAEINPFSIALSGLPRLDPVSFASALPAAARPAMLDIESMRASDDLSPLIDDYMIFEDARDF